MDIDRLIEEIREAGCLPAGLLCPGAQRGEQAVYSFNAGLNGGSLFRREIGIDAAPVVLATGIIGLTYGCLDQNNAVTTVAANVRTVTITLTTQKGAGQPQVRVTLTGEDDATKSVNLSRPFRLGERYEFQDLAPGKYRLVAKAEDGAPALELWNQNVTVEAGQVTQLPLSATNSKVTPDQFPGPAPK